MRAKKRNTQPLPQYYGNHGHREIYRFMGPKCTVCSLLPARANIQWETSAPAVTPAQTRLFVLLNDIQPEGLRLKVTSALETEGQ